MKNELKINSSLFLEKDYMVDMLERYCNRKAFVNSEHEYPFTFGFTEKGDPIIKNLPDLGNILIFGDTGKTHYHFMLFAQMLFVDYVNKPKLALFDDTMQTLGVFFGNWHISKYYIGAAEELAAFLHSLEREKARRQRDGGKDFPYTVYFVYLDYHSLKDTFNMLRDKFYTNICDGLKELGLQLIVCAGNSRTTEFVLPYMELFDTTIGTKTLKLPEYSELMTDEGVIKHKGNEEKFVYWGDAIPCSDLED